MVRGGGLKFPSGTTGHFDLKHLVNQIIVIYMCQKSGMTELQHLEDSVWRQTIPVIL